MKVIIGKGSIKREINGAFALCGSKKDLLALAAQIQTQIALKDDFYYGWIPIWPEALDEARPNTPPLPWEP